MSVERVKGELAAWIRGLIEPRIDLLAFYPARVVSQASDGTLQVQPDNARLPVMTGVPIRLGLPASSVKVAAGSRVLIGFEGGDARYPMATLWAGSTVTEIALAGGSDYVALATELRAELDDIRAKFASHTHGGVTSGSAFTGNPGASTPPTTLNPAKVIAATKVKAT